MSSSPCFGKLSGKNSSQESMRIMNIDECTKNITEVLLAWIIHSFAVLYRVDEPFYQSS